jgi:glycosyltransferase involved in cell wall biosynthesis
MSGTWLGFQRRFVDALRHHPTPRMLAALGLWLRTRLRRQTPLARVLTLARAAHICPTGITFRNLCRSLRDELDHLDPADIDWSRIGKQPADVNDVPKGILLKPPISPREKGVLHVPFEDQWLRLFRSGQAAAIAQRYDLILGPSWSPPPEPALLLALKLWPGRLYTFLSNHTDAERMRALSRTLMPIPLLSSSWVDPSSFEPYLKQRRDLDIVMLANFATFKRHWLLFDALRSLPASCTVLLMGVGMEGRTEGDLLQEAARFGVAGRFDLLVKPTREQIARNLARARVSLVLSRREGSCVAVTESLFADTPVGLVRGAHIGSRYFLNDRTGRLLREAHLASDLAEFIATADSYRPRAWALSHITYRHSTALLNHTLREMARQDGVPWTRDIEPISKDTISRYPDPEGALAMQPHIDAFEREYGLRLGRGIGTSKTPTFAAVA